MDIELAGEGIAVRAFTEGDRGFVFDSWVRSYKPNAKIGSSEAYERGQRALIGALLKSCRVLIACTSDAPTAILGWACGDPERSHLHYAFVRQELRNVGLARRLIEETLGTYPRRIYVTHRFINNDESRGRFVHNPYPLMVAT